MKKFSTEEKLDAAKCVVKLVVGYGTGIIATGIVINNAMPKNTPQKIAVVVAGTAIAMMAREKMSAFADAKFDETVAWARETFKKENRPEEDPNIVEA